VGSSKFSIYRYEISIGAQLRVTHRQAVRAVKRELLVLGLSECSDLSIQHLRCERAHPIKFCFTISQLELTAWSAGERQPDPRRDYHHEAAKCEPARRFHAV
jgi:hypothetical protein